jgi:hypothetical protein
LALSRASGPIFMFCAPGLIFGGTEVVRFRFHVSSPGQVFGGTEGVGSRFQVLLSQTHFRRYRGHRVPFPCFARPDLFLAELRASALIFMYSVPRLVFGGTESNGSCFHVLCVGTSFWRYRGRRIPFLCFQRKEGRLVPFSCFARPDSFSAETRVSSLIFLFCAPRRLSRGTEGAGSRFHALRTRTRFRRYHRHRVPFSCFAS